MACGKCQKKAAAQKQEQPQKVEVSKSGSLIINGKEYVKR